MILNDSINNDDLAKPGGLSNSDSIDRIFALVPGGFSGSMPLMARSSDGSYIMVRIEDIVSRFIDSRFFGIVWVDDLYVLGVNKDLNIEFIPVEYVFKRRYNYEVYYLGTSIGGYVVGGSYDQRIMVYDPDTGDIYTSELSNIKPGDHLVYICGSREIFDRYSGAIGSNEEAEGLIAGYLYAMAKLGIGFRLGPKALYINLDSIDPNDLILMLKSLDMISSISKIDRMENSIAIYSDSITPIVKSVTRGFEVMLPESIYASRTYAYGFVRGLVNIVRNLGEDIYKLPEIYWILYMYGIKINGIESRDSDIGIGYDEIISKDKLGMKGICTCRINRIIVRRSSGYLYGVKTSYGSSLSGLIPIIGGSY